MKVSTIIILIAFPIISFAQNDLIGKFADKSYGKKYIIFRPDSTFTFEIGFHLQHDIGCGLFKTIKDTIYLKYQYDMTDSCCNIQKINIGRKNADGKYELIIEPETAWRPDTLFYQKNKLYQVRNGTVVTKTAKFQMKPNGHKPEDARRKYFLFGPYVFKERPTFYMERLND